jgi:hypothetical protein
MSEEISTPEDSEAKATTRSTTKTVKEPTVLEQLQESLSKKVERASVFIEVPERPGITIEVSPNITQHQMRSWRKQAGEDTKAGMDATKFAAAVVGHTTIAIWVNDQPAVDDSGLAFTFGSDEILRLTNTTRPIPDCVQAFFGIDPHVESAALAILDAAGYGDTVETTTDPTLKS